MYPYFTKNVLAIVFSSIILFYPAIVKSQSSKKLNKFEIASTDAIKDFFHYTGNDIPLVSAHRGGSLPGFPENCIQTFEHTLAATHALLEIDPHYTKDSFIVLMHDPTLNRTSTGNGAIVQYTLQELKSFRLKDTKGNVTRYMIPTLEAVLNWAKGKTILVLDEKDVPIEQRVNIVTKNNAENTAIIMAYTFSDAQKAYALNKNIMLEVMINSIDKIHQFDSMGVPWGNVVVFVSHVLPDDKLVIDSLHNRGVMCIYGTSRNYDKDYYAKKINETQLINDYIQLVQNGVDIIEADLSIKAGIALKAFLNKNSEKKHYFK